MRTHRKHGQDVLRQIFFLYHAVGLKHRPSPHPYLHMPLLFFLHNVLLLNYVFPKAPDYLIDHPESTPLLLLLSAA